MTFSISSRAGELHTAPSVLGTPSELACTVCGHHALSRNAPHELASVDRLYCLLCGAHRLLSQAP